MALMKMPCAVGTGGGGTNKVSSSTYSTTSSGGATPWADTNIPSDKVSSIYFAGSSYTDLFLVSEGTSTYVRGDLYNGAPLFAIDASGSTLKIGQRYTGSSSSFTADIFYAE